MNIPDELTEFRKTIDRSKFNNTPYFQKITKPWGYELIFTPEDLPYTGKIMHMMPGTRQSLQIHDKKVETYFLAKGKANLLIERSDGEMETVEMKEGVGYTTKVGQKHRLMGVSECDIWEVSTPETGNTYRLEDDYNRETETEEIRKNPNRGWNPN